MRKAPAGWGERGATAPLSQIARVLFLVGTFYFRDVLLYESLAQAKTAAIVITIRLRCGRGSTLDNVPSNLSHTNFQEKSLE